MAIQAIDRASELTTNKVLRDTYRLLSMTLLFSALTAALSVYVGAPRGLAMICTFGAIGLVWFVLPRFENSAAGIWVVFGFTGLLGFGLGPMLSYYLSIPSGASTVATALGGTGIIFLGLSAFTLVSKRDFSFMGGFLFAGLIVVFLAAIANIFLAMPALSIAVSAGIILLMSGMILFHTSQIVNGGERNYISATVSLYLAIYNIFQSLLMLLGILGDD